MDALTALLTRTSVAKLVEPAPTADQISLLIQAANRAADHGRLTPWRFLLVEGKAREALGELFLRASSVVKPELSAAESERFLAMPLRAPSILISIARFQEHPKVPRDEQRMAAAAATQQIITAAFALGLGAIWRTGDLAANPAVKSGLGLKEDEEIVGFVYLGAPAGDVQPPKCAEVSDFLTIWQG